MSSPALLLWWLDGGGRISDHRQLRRCDPHALVGSSDDDSRNSSSRKNEQWLREIKVEGGVELAGDSSNSIIEGDDLGDISSCVGDDRDEMESFWDYIRLGRGCDLN